ncbi:Flagellar hook-basal body complex protein FliE [Neorhizobium galegae bv. officinalis bv. officinalis str. HAMBI 1141]|jgi:flagellar hook-basal body complex protein FliE|uniref:Flagellar hook-basal body complex protein FliE n=1 Tax=Neorhizobium galegae bv. officinalis bv. officinalis str. HAMBI 1141 TaxID=1028801 RepID=A0A068T3J3_NEOGA|nr:flagellar hook-basal body complex protein FliE [Neorhizobium galegae]CDN52601.1 Flagellar hook-basal body complex protein FliE [Neorhizobium galegae bv. officinalis bv. officinalis str. HAMBI 1141]
MIDKIQNVSSLSLSNGIDEVGSTNSSVLAGGIATTPGQNTGMDFGSVMASMATDTMNSLKGAESMSFKAIQGKANTREVVDAVLEAQQSLQTAMALRDKIVSAYLEVTKMQI